MKDRIIAALIISLMFLSLVACNGNVKTPVTAEPGTAIITTEAPITLTDEPLTLKTELPSETLTCAEIIDYIYENCGKVAFFDNLSASGNKLITKEITPAFCGAYFGTDIQFSSAAASEPDMQPPAYSLCVAIMPDGSDMDYAKKAVADNADPAKWICTGVSTVYVESLGNRLVLIMADKETADALKTAFLSLGE